MADDQMITYLLCTAVIGFCAYQLGRGAKRHIINNTIEALISFKYIKTRKVNGEIEMIPYDGEK